MGRDTSSQDSDDDDDDDDDEPAAAVVVRRRKDRTLHDTETIETATEPTCPRATVIT
jgi:hypothetical protein